MKNTIKIVQYQNEIDKLAKVDVSVLEGHLSYSEQAIIGAFESSDRKIKAGIINTLLNGFLGGLFISVGYIAALYAIQGITTTGIKQVIFGIVFPVGLLLVTFLGAIIGSASGSLLLTVAGVTSNGIGNGAWLGVLSIQPFSQVNGVNTFIGTGFIWFIISGLLTMGVSMTLTWFLEKIPRFTKLRNELLNIKGKSLLNFRKQPNVVENT
ncbi:MULTISPECIES: formate/nitrite transporter family protein [unclassified Spiroplasma]|uniref:formate/nitrite transporter family protein n=1 Tax=unclassified Spiroplasma TaxID=2637901 RepID=UPI0030D17E19